jgi:hypothetical protein
MVKTLGIKLTEDQTRVSEPCIVGRNTAGGGGLEELTGAQVVEQLPAATAEAAGKMTAEQAALICMLVKGVFGGIYVNNNNTSQSIPAGAGYTKSTAFGADGISSYCTSDAANDRIVIDVAGVYEVACYISFTAGTNNFTVRGAVFLDGVEQSNCHAERFLGTGADIGSMSCGGKIQAAVGDVIDLRLNHSSASAANITLRFANLSISYKGSGPPEEEE